MDVIKLISMLLVGGIGGFAAPMLAQKLIDYKGKQKNKEMPVQPQYHSIMCKLICAVCSAVGLGVCAYFKASWLLLILAAVIWILGMVVLLVDMRIRIIANETVLGLLALAVVFRFVIAGGFGLLNSLASMVAVMFVWMILGRFIGFGKVGAGDVKLCGVIGFLYGYPNLSTPILIMAVGLLIFCIGGLLFRKMTLKTMFAMGPFLVAGMLCGLPYLFYTMM